jgi:hypothetical protein
MLAIRAGVLSGACCKLGLWIVWGVGRGRATFHQDQTGEREKES